MQKRRSTNKRTLKIFGIALAGLIVLAMLMPSTPAGKSKNEQVIEAPAPAEVIVSASTYYEDYNSNEIAADNKYKGKRIQITGKVYSVGKTMGSAFIDLEGIASLPTVHCVMKNENSLASVAKGEIITLIGTGSGKIIFGSLDDCEIK